MTPKPSPRSGDWLEVASVASLEPGSVQTVEADGCDLALACCDDGVFALEASCCHEGGPLGEGSLDGTTLTCPLHGWQFDIKSGACLTDKRFRQPALETQIRNGKVLVQMGGPSGKTAVKEDVGEKRSGVEVWKAQKHGLDVWPDLLRYAQQATPMSKIDKDDLERMKWYGFFQRKKNDEDHYMCRVRVPGCELSAGQMRALAFIAYESGYSIVDVTTRANLQIQGLTIDKLPGVRAALERVGLTSRQSGHDNVRNVTCHPFSGHDPLELVDTRGVAQQMQAMVVGSRELADLPRKFNVALSGRAEAAPHFWTQDLACVATAQGSQVVFHLLVGGTQGQSPKMATALPVVAHEEQLLGVLAACLRTFRELGHRHNRAQVRFRYLLERLGAEETLRQIEARLGYELEPWQAPPPPPATQENFVGWFPQRQEGRWMAGVSVPVGRLTWEQCEGLALVASRYGGGSLRTTYDQNIVIPDIPAAQRQEVEYELARYGLSCSPDSICRSLVACTGRQFCNLAVTETKGYAFRLMEELRRRRIQLQNISIHMSGCPSSCANSHTADIGLKGVKARRGLRVLDAFDVYLAGGLGGEVELGLIYRRAVPFDQLADLVAGLVSEFYLKRHPQETFSAFWRRRLGSHQAEKVESELPRWSCGACGYLHISEDPPPLCPSCSALRSRFEPALPALEDGGGAEAAPERAPAPTSAPAARTFKKRQGKRVVIVGGSIAGHTAAQSVRTADPAARITLVTDEEHGFYNRLNLTRLYAQEVDRTSLFDYREKWYQEQGVEWLQGSRAIALDSVKQNLLLEEGRELGYDRLILAHGASARVPPSLDTDLEGVFLLRTLADVEGMMAQTRPGVQVVVVGGGVLGLEAACGARSRGAEVTVLEYEERLMPRQLDGPGSALVRGKIEEQGIKTRLRARIAAVTGTGRVDGLVLDCGETLGADLVIVSTGILPNVDWVKRSGIDCARGVVVDDRMQTSCSDVFAAGDVTEWRGQVMGLWTNALEQARVAGENAAGKLSLFRGVVPVTVVKCLKFPVQSMGEVAEDGGNISSAKQVDPEAGTYLRIVHRRGIPVGAILLGTSKGLGELKKLVENGIGVEQLQSKLIHPEELNVA